MAAVGAFTSMDQAEGRTIFQKPFCLTKPFVYSFIYSFICLFIYLLSDWLIDGQ